MRSQDPIRIKQALPTTILFAIVLLAGAVAAVPAAAQQPAAAPLDTLHDLPPLGDEQDIRYVGADIDISRKLLPDVQATTVPQARTPKRPPRLDDPVAGAWRFHLARQAAIGGDPGAVREHLKEAVQAAPTQPRYQWWQSAQAVKGLDSATLLHALPASLRALVDDPVARGQAIVLWHQGALWANGIFWTLLVAALTLACWRHLSHDLVAMFLKDRRHGLRGKLPLVLPLMILLLRPGWFGFLALLSVPLLIQTRGRVRALLATTWLIALVLVFPGWPFLRQAAPTVDPASEVTLLRRACTLPPSAALDAQLRERLASNPEPARRDRLTNALAIQEARRGDFDDSSKLFGAVLDGDPDNFTALVGLANNTYYQGRMDEAAAGFERAAARHPNRGEIPYNLAQVYFKKLFVPEATAALDQARALGFTQPGAVFEPSDRADYSPVVYPALTGAAFAAACRDEAAAYPPLVTVAAWRNLMGLPPLQLYLVVGAPFLLACLLIMRWSRQNDPRGCENCGVPVCGDCCKVRDSAWLCPSCGETADRARSDLILGTLLKNRSRAEGLAHSHRLVRLGRLVPGAGHLASERVLAGWFRLTLLAAGLFLLTAGWAFDPGAEWASPGLTLPGETLHPVLAPLPAALWPGWTSPPVLAGAVLIVMALLMALLDGPGLRRGIPERFSLTPQAGAKQTDGDARDSASRRRPGDRVVAR